MLDVIKSIINRKRSFLEAVDLILEDMESDEIVDSLLDDKLTDDGDVPSEDSSDDGEDHFEFDDGGALGDDSEKDSSGPVGDYGIDNSFDADASAPSEESPDDEISDIFAISVDTRTNTVRDILPVAPMNASDAIVGDSDAKVDSGFGNESGDVNPMDGFLDENTGLFFRGSKRRYFLEGLDDGSGSSSDDAPAMDDSIPEAPSPDGDSNQETEVTTKVKENISDENKDSSSDSSLDADIPSDLGSDSSSDSSSSADSSSSGNAKAKEKLKLISDINKKLFDLRDDIIDDIQ